MAFQTRSRDRSGVGAIFFIATAIVVVLSIMVMANSLFTSKVQEQAVDISVADRAGTVAESAVEEVAYRLLSRLNDPDGDLELYDVIRKFDGNPSVSTEESPFLEGRTAVLEPVLTQRAYQDTTEVQAGKVTAGPEEQLPLTNASDSNESYGTFGFEEAARVTPPGNFRSVERKVYFSKTFKVVLLAPPYPFNKYTLFLKEPRRFRAYFERYEQAREQVDALNVSLPADRQIVLPDFPIEDGGSTRPIFSTAGTVESAATAMSSLSPANPIDPATILASVQADFARVASQLKRQPTAETSEFEDKQYYDPFSEAALERRATHIYDNFAELLGRVSRNGVLVLNGFYLVRRGVTLDMPWTGRGVIATTSPEGIRVKSAEKQGDGRLVLVASRGPVDLSPLSSTDTLQADVLAPEGVLDGASGKRIEGIVMVRDLAGSPDPYAPGPTITRPAESDYEPWTGGGALSPDYKKQLAFFLNPGFLKREYQSKREKSGN